jgi:hypothetical protein
VVGLLRRVSEALPWNRAADNIIAEALSLNPTLPLADSLVVLPANRIFAISGNFKIKDGILASFFSTI